MQKWVQKLRKWKNVTWRVFCQRSSIKCNFDIVSDRLRSRRLLESHGLCYTSHSSSSHSVNIQRQLYSSNPELIFVWLLTPILMWLWNSVCIWSSCDTLTAEVWCVSNYSSHLRMFELLQLQIKCKTHSAVTQVSMVQTAHPKFHYFIFSTGSYRRCHAPPN